MCAYLHGPFSKAHHFCIIAVPQVGYATQKIRLNSQQPFARYGRSKLRFNFFVFSSYAVRGATGASISFRTLSKNCYKMQTCDSIATIFGTNEECVTVDSRTKFVVNLSNIQGVMSVYSRKKDQTSVTATG